MSFLRNVWYVAAWSHEVLDVLLARTLLGKPVVFYRDETGDVVALEDRCPHRFVPLSAGRIVEGVVECGYHGLRFDATGTCVRNPHGDGRIPPEARVRSYPVHEQHGIVWFWPGDAELADPALIPAGLEVLDGPQTGYRPVHNYIHGKFAYDLLVDNLMDLSHADFLHLGSFSTGHVEEVEQRVRRQGRNVVVERRQYNVEIAPAMKPLYDSEGQKVDGWQDFVWAPPGVILYDSGVVKTKHPREEGGRFFMVHIATPETESTTHYFASMSRPTELNDADQDEVWRNVQLGPLLNEDSPMLEMQQHAFAGRDFWSMRPVLLQTDTGPIQVRRAMEGFIRSEQQGETGQPDGADDPAKLEATAIVNAAA